MTPGPDTEADATATASSPTPEPGARSAEPATPTPSTPSLAGRELAALAGRELHPERSRRYEVGASIGRGGMGEVFVARDLDIGREVAVKRMRSREPSAEAIARFLREAQVQGRLEHPAIVPVHDLGVDTEGRPFFTMKRLAGTTLFQLLQRGDAEQRRMLRAFVEVCLAIELAHVRGVIHRDLKPSNIMLGDFGEVYVLDWGVARVIGVDDVPVSDDGSSDTSSGGMTVPGSVLGTPGYMAPEQRRGDPDVGPAADVYALGRILAVILAASPSPPPPELEAAYLAATAEDAAARPSARALSTFVQDYLDGDRDAQRRRVLAAEQVAEAELALRAGERAAAMRAAGRALALDPTSTAAAQLVSRLVLEPPTARPPEVDRELAERDRETVTRQGYSAARSLAMAAVALGLLMWLFGRSIELALVAFAVPAASAAHAYITSLQKRPFHLGDVAYILLSNVALIIVLSRLFGVYLIVPAMATASMSGVCVLPPMLGRYNRVWLVFATAFVIPVVLEATGVWARTTTFSAHGILIEPLHADVHGGVELAVLAGILALLYAGGRYVHDLAIANRDAQARLELQAWHLRQLIPPAAG